MSPLAPTLHKEDKQKRLILIHYPADSFTARTIQSGRRAVPRALTFCLPSAGSDESVDSALLGINAGGNVRNQHLLPSPFVWNAVTGRAEEATQLPMWALVKQRFRI